MIIKVLGPGCSSCIRLERDTRDAVDALGMEAVVEKVEDYPTIAAFGVMSTPALVIDGEVVVAGRVPGPAELRRLLGGRAAEPPS